MRITLIKCAEWPDPEADLGAHEFTYSLLPHEGDWRQGGTVREARAFNSSLLPVLFSAGESKESSPVPFLEVDRESAAVEAVKQAEDGNGFIIRFCEHHGSRGKVTVKTAFQRFSVTECNLMEEPCGDKEECNSGRFSFHLGPYELKTFRIITV
jgi:alpha-mannosidase